MSRPPCSRQLEWRYLTNKSSAPKKMHNTIPPIARHILQKLPLRIALHAQGGQKTTSFTGNRDQRLIVRHDTASNRRKMSQNTNKHISSPHRIIKKDEREKKNFIRNSHYIYTLGFHNRHNLIVCPRWIKKHPIQTPTTNHARFSIQPSDNKQKRKGTQRGPQNKKYPWSMCQRENPYV